MALVLYGLAHDYQGPGYGPGTSTPAGTTEPQVSIVAGRTMTSALISHGVRVVYLRGHMKQKTRIARKHIAMSRERGEPVIALELHQNAPGEKWSAETRLKARGMAIFYAAGDLSKSAAEMLLADLSALVPMDGKRRRTIAVPSPDYPRLKFVVDSGPPSVLIELGYSQTDPTFAAWIDIEENQRRVGERIAETLITWLNTPEKG